MTSTTTPPVTPAEHADAAYEAVRAINHATIRPGPIEPQEVASTLGSLSLLGHGLVQACTQLARAVTRSAGDYDLYDDTGRDPADTVAIAEDHLRQAAALTEQLAAQLDHAHAAANHLGYHPSHDTANDTADDTADDIGRDMGGSVAGPVMW